MNSTIILENIKSKMKSMTYFISVVLIGIVSLSSFNSTIFASAGTKLYLSPASQNVNVGSNVTVNILIDPSGSSLNTVQTVVSYPSSSFKFVSLVQGSAFGSFPNTNSSGSVSFAAASTTAITTPVTVATLTLQATAGGSPAVSLATVCASGNYALTCSAAYDSVTSNNDLSIIGNANYSITQPAPQTCPSGDTGIYPNCVSPVPVGTSVKPTYTAPSSTSKPSNSSNPPATTPNSPTVNSPTPTKYSGTPASLSASSYLITLKIVDSSNKPVVGATVTLNNTKVITDSQGVATFNTQPGSYNISVSGGGVKPYSTNIIVQPKQSTQQFTVSVKRNSNLILTIILILTILIIIGAGIYILNKMRKNKIDKSPKDKSSQDPISPTVISPINTIDNISDKTDSNNSEQIQPNSTIQPITTIPTLITKDESINSIQENKVTPINIDITPIKPTPATQQPIQPTTINVIDHSSTLPSSSFHPNLEPNISSHQVQTTIKPTNNNLNSTISTVNKIQVK